MNALIKCITQFAARPFALLSSLALFVSVTAFAQSSAQTGSASESNKIEVTEYFAYGCGHCYNLEAPFNAWKSKVAADVRVRRIPSPALIAGVDSTTLYYTLEALGQIDRLHPMIFNAIHEERIILGNTQILLKWLEKNGVDPRKYEEVAKSFSVSSKVNRARGLIDRFKIEVVPTITVEIATRQVMMSPGQQTQAAFLAQVDDAIAQMRAQGVSPRAPASAQTPARK
jgi:protein dithiol oxidoreductase (disulfide-forming)